MSQPDADTLRLDATKLRALASWHDLRDARTATPVNWSSTEVQRDLRRIAGYLEDLAREGKPNPDAVDAAWRDLLDRAAACGRGHDCRHAIQRHEPVYGPDAVTCRHCGSSFTWPCPRVRYVGRHVGWGWTP